MPANGPLSAANCGTTRYVPPSLRSCRQLGSSAADAVAPCRGTRVPVAADTPAVAMRSNAMRAAGLQVASFGGVVGPFSWQAPTAIGSVRIAARRRRVIIGSSEWGRGVHHLPKASGSGLQGSAPARLVGAEHGG